MLSCGQDSIGIPPRYEWLETLPEYDSDTPGYVRIDEEAYVFTD